jgi:hypothetical protein
MLKLSIFNAQGPKVIIIIVHAGASENICSTNGGDQEKGKT